MKRRIVSVLMALVMALSLLPVQALAEDAAVGEPVTEIEQAEQIGEGKEPGDPEEQTEEGEEPGDPEEEQEPEDTVLELQCNLDDMTPEDIGFDPEVDYE